MQNDLPEVIQPLLTLLQEFNIKTVDDRCNHQYLLMILKLLIPRFPESIPIILSNISETLPQILEMNINVSLYYIVFTINEILLYCHSVSEFTPGTIHSLIEIGTKMLEQNNSISLNFRKQKIVCEGAMIFQLIFQYVESLTQTQTEEILSKTYQQYTRTQNRFIHIQLLGIVLSAIYAKFEATQNSLHLFINLLVENALQFSNIPYLRKILIMGLSRVLSRTNLPEFFMLRLPELFNILISFAQLTQLQHQTKEEESHQSNSRSSRALLQGFLNDRTLMEEEKAYEKEIEEDNEDDDENEEDLQELNNGVIRKMTDTLKTKLKEEDELKFFKNEILLFSKNNPERLQSLIQNLSKTKKDFIEKILSQ